MTIEEMRTNLMLATDRKTIIDRFNEKVNDLVGKFGEDRALPLIKNSYDAYMVCVAICTMDSVTERQTFYAENNIDIWYEQEWLEAYQK